MVNPTPPFVKSVQTSMIVNLLTQLVKSGDVTRIVSYEELNKCCEGDVQKRNRSNLISAIRIVERDTHRLIGCIPKMGIKLLDPKEQTNIPPAAVSYVRNKIRRTINRMAKTQYDLLSTEQKKQHNVYSSLLGAITVFTDSGTKRIVETKVNDKPMDLTETIRLFSS